MVRTVIETHANIDHGITGQIAAGHGFSHAFLDCGNIIARDRAADNLIDELETFPRRERLDLEPSIAELAAAPGLFFQLSLGAGATANGFLVRDFGRLQNDFRAVLAL